MIRIPKKPTVYGKINALTPHLSKKQKKKSVKIEMITVDVLRLILINWNQEYKPNDVKLHICSKVPSVNKTDVGLFEPIVDKN